MGELAELRDLERERDESRAERDGLVSRIGELVLKEARNELARLQLIAQRDTLLRRIEELERKRSASIFASLRLMGAALGDNAPNPSDRRALKWFRDPQVAFSAGTTIAAAAFAGNALIYGPVPLGTCAGIVALFSAILLWTLWERRRAVSGHGEDR